MGWPQRNQQAGAKRSKYGAIVTVVDGISFHSKHESREYLRLKQLEACGAISDLRLQVRFDLNINEQRWCYMKLDFTYLEEGEQIAHDAKGMVTPEWKLKAKAFKILYPGWELRTS